MNIDLHKQKRTKASAIKWAGAPVPHAGDCEPAIIGCILLSPNDCFDECQAKFKGKSEVFYDQRIQTIYDCIAEMRAANEEVDVITLQQKLKDKQMLEQIGGLSFLAKLPDFVPSAANLSYYLDFVWEKFLLRNIIHACQWAVGHIYDSEGEAVEVISEVLSAFQNIEDGTQGALEAKTLSARMIDDLERRYGLYQKGTRSGLVTGFTKLDYLTDGLQFSEQTIIGARPNIGKTAIALNVVKRVCLQDQIPTAFVTLEMSPEALAKRLLSDWSNIQMGALRTGSFGESEAPKMTSFSTMLAQRPIHIIDGSAGGMTCAQVVAEVRRVWRKHGVRLVVIDYLQKITPDAKHEKRTYEVAETSKSLKGLAVETKAAFLTLCQLNRESEKEKNRRPRLSDLADSGQIERDGDVIGLLHRPDKSLPESELIIAKQRDGELGIVDLHFNGQFCRFQNPPLPQDANQ